MNDNTDQFELLDATLSSTINDEFFGYTAILDVQDRSVGVPIAGHECALLAFTDIGCAENSHIHTVHQLCIKFKEQCGFELKRVIIEAKHGDVIYCRLNWYSESKDIDIFNVVSIGDALIFHTLTGGELQIAKFVADQLDDIDSEGIFESSDF